MNINETILGYFRVTTIIPKTKVSEVSWNLEEHKRCIKAALQGRPDLIVFPELSLTGYTCGDLFLTDDLMYSVTEAIEDLKTWIGCENIRVPIIFGAPVASEDGRLFNAAVVLGDGEIGVVYKKHLPGYSEFYESRWYTPGDLCGRGMYRELPYLVVRGVRVGIEICEDLWVPCPPCESLVTKDGVEVMVNLSASPSLAGKLGYLRSLLGITSGRLLCGYVYVSSGPWESSTDLVFSGISTAYENGKRIGSEVVLDGSLMGYPKVQSYDIDIHELRGARRKNRTSTRIDSDTWMNIERPGEENLEPSPSRVYDPHPFLKAEDYPEVFKIQSVGLQKRLSTTGGKLVVGVSGGTDSTLALLVAADAMDKLGLPRTNIIGVTMPCFGTTSRTKDNSWKLMEALGIDSREINISESVTAHLRELGHPLDVFDIAYENAQARMRTQILFNLSNMIGGIVLGTGDLSELSEGWCTITGDLSSSYNVNASVPKTLVKALISWYASENPEVKDVLLDILGTPISPELIPGGKQESESSVGPYELIDYFLYHFLRSGMGSLKILYTCFWAFSGKYNLEEIRTWELKFFKRFGTQQFKRSCLPDGPKTGSISLSPRGDWRMPSDVWLSEYLKPLEDYEG